MPVSNFPKKNTFPSSWISWMSCLLLISLTTVAKGETGRYRLSWRENPSTTMVVGWEQFRGTDPIVYYDTQDHDRNYQAYRFSQIPNKTVYAMDMHNHFARLRGLQPNTVYYFVIRDSDGTSRRFSFKTAPDSPNERLSIIAGGDSRNHQVARQNANKLVAKLRPHCVVFSGDMTNNDSGPEWKEWLDDWQLTISGDGHMTPIIPARGNHEKEDASILNLFDINGPEMYYALSLGGNLLRIYTLNSSLPAGGNQKAWLERDLNAHPNVIWKFAQYHASIRPHTARKPERNDQLLHWATLFYKHRVNLCLESDAHVVKSTWPLRPSNEPGSHEGFIRDDYNGTVYIGEGGWGAPLRSSNDAKPWTRDLASFNQFKLIFVDAYKMEVRTVQTEGADAVGVVDPDDVFRLPSRLSIWNPPNGSVITINRPGQAPPPDKTAIEQEQFLSKDIKMEIRDFSVRMDGPSTLIQWSTGREPKGIEFEVQRSVDDFESYETIATIAGKGADLNNYECPDDKFYNGDPTEITYRLAELMEGKAPSYYYPKIDARESISGWERFPKLLLDANDRTKVAYILKKSANITIVVLNTRLKTMSSLQFATQPPGKYMKTIDFNLLPTGRYLVVVRADERPIRRFRVDKE